MQSYFEGIDKIRYEGSESTNPLAFRHYDRDKVVLGKTMAEHLRFAACYWHNFCYDGSDMFGTGTYKRPWLSPDNSLEIAKLKADNSFDFFTRLGVDYYSFHDVDIAPQGESIREYIDNMAIMIDVLEQKQHQTGMRLLWGTANVFSHPRYMSGAASNPDPEVYAYAATQVFTAMNATKRLNGENYVLWGGREGYDTLLNTDLRQEREQLGRFFRMAIEHKHKIGFQGTILIEPKPSEPTKHQYDYDVATVYGFLKQFGLENEVKTNIEVNHATLAGHSFQHEISTAIALGIFGSIDANRGDPQLGWDTDQFPKSVEEWVPIWYELLRSGGLNTGGLMFDAKLRRQSIDPKDYFHAHIGAMDVLARSLECAASLIEQGSLNRVIDDRYSGWHRHLGRSILLGDYSLEELAQYATERNIDPQPVSGQQELLENLVNREIY